jgi:D-tyrosyl-tRNA(Tyr) deacylase
MAFVDGKAADKSVVPFGRAVALAILAGVGEQAVRMARAGVEVLKQRGFDQQSAELRKEVENQLKLAGLSMPKRDATAEPAQHGTLPAKCPACLAPVRADEVEWIDETSAECAFCGTTLKAS